MKKVKVEFNSIGNGLMKAILTNLEELYSERANEENENDFSITISENHVRYNVQFKEEELGGKKIGTPIGVHIRLIDLGSEQDILVHVAIEKLVVREAVITTEIETLFRGHAGDVSDLETILAIVGVIDVLDDFSKGNDGFNAYKELIRPELANEENPTIKEVLTKYKEVSVNSILDNLTYAVLSILDSQASEMEEIVSTEEFQELRIRIKDNSNLATESIDYINAMNSVVEDFVLAINTEKVSIALDEESEFSGEDYDEMVGDVECDCGHHHEHEESEEDYAGEEPSDDDIAAVEDMVDTILNEHDDIDIDDILSYLGKVNVHKNLDIDYPDQLSDLVNLLHAKEEVGIDPFDLAFRYIEYYHENYNDNEDDDDIVYDSEE